MFKIVALPRYACSFNGISEAELKSADKSLATFIRNSVSLDFTLSKAIIYNSKAIGGLGLTAQSVLTNIEIACSANRLFNSSSKLIKSVKEKCGRKRNVNVLTVDYVKLTLRFVRHHKNSLTKLLDRILNNEFMAQCFH